MATKETLKKENQKVLNFIKQWQKDNNYTKEHLKQYNFKFDKDFKQFLRTEKISKETTNFFLK